MGGNTFGTLFRITTWGESHGKAVGVVIDGCPPMLELNEQDVQRELDRRKPGQSKITTQRMEGDKVEILSGVFEGKTTGTPIAMIVFNKAAEPKFYEPIKDAFRPGHADYTYLQKYGIRDYTGGGRASGRETIGRVAAGAVAKKLLSKDGISVIGYVKQVGSIVAEKVDYKEIERNIVRCPDMEKAKLMEGLIMKTRGEADSVGGVVELVAKGVPAGLGEPVFDQISADIAKAVMSIPAIKGVEIGSGFAAASMRGSEHNDAMRPKFNFASNNAGGVLGGITSGQDIIVRIAVKPASSIPQEQDTVTVDGKATKIRVTGKHDPCICPRVVPVAEAMLALVIADHLLRQKAVRV
ncbi:chorismate synthase [Candidatus Woesearchaeota archaeon]|nr:chorismate synthase [Candidatus Woesearchaeota archaeon]